jgi:hypothetical protein
MKKIVLAICLLIAIVSKSQNPKLFSNTTDTGTVAEFFDSTVIVKKNIVINVNNLKSLDNDTLTIELPGMTAPVDIIKTNQSINPELNSFRWFGKILGSPNSFVLLTNVGSAVAGYIRDNNKIYRIEYRGNNVHQIASINNKYAKPDKVRRVTSNAGSSYATDTTSCCDTVKIIDIMVVYTAEAAEEVAGNGGILSLIDLCIEISNTSFINSGINARLNLVHAEQINYSDQNTADTNLDRITNNPGGMFNNVYEMRNTYKADIVVLMVNMMYGYSGIANVMTTNTIAFESSAFAVVSRRESLASHLVFTHEVGHVMGAGHDRCDDPNWEGLYHYSHGHVGSTYRTIMSETGNNNRIEYWSNPNLTYIGDGLPMGEDEGCLSNNTLTLNRTINTVSKFRCRDGSQCSKPCKWYKCWVFWVSILLASIIIIWFIFRRKRRPRI